MMNLKNAAKHFKLITHHKWIVFQLCCKIGLPWRGMVHDLSKYSLTEFKEGITYYKGTCSSIVVARQKQGYSKAWLHHKGRNKHHEEYWIDDRAPIQTPIIPYPYAAEMLCDKIAAGIIYQGKNWTKEYQLTYWEKEKEEKRMHPQIKAFFTEIIEQVAKEGIDKTYTKSNFQRAYRKHCDPKNL